MAEYWDRERGRRYRGEGYYGGYYGYPEREREWGHRGDDRGFFDRAGDEVRSWFGDEEAYRRRLRDERERGDRGWWRERDEERPRDWRAEDAEREWARQWGYVEGRGMRGPDYDARGWGYSGGYGAGPGFVGGWSGQQRYGSRFSGPERYAGDADRWMRRGMTGGPHVGRGPRGYQRSDERIREDVCERMAECGELDASDIEVRVSNGEVTLQGTVRERHDRRLAEDIVDDVAGVREVHNEIRVSQAGQELPQQRYRIA
ncbi:MAG TPA: BON domain-containing protein [Methylomirabilota bacterium]